MHPTLSLTLAVAFSLLPLGATAGATPGPELQLRGQHSNTGEVRAIALTPRRVWVATAGGLAVHRRSDGRHLCTLSSGDGLPGNSLHTVAARHDGLLVGGDFGAVLLPRPERACGPRLQVRAVRGLSGIEPFDPVFGHVRQGRRSFVVRHQRGLSRLRARKGGQLEAGEGSSRVGLWRAAASTGDQLVLGGLDGTLLFYAARARLGEPRAALTLDLPVLALAAQGQNLVVATGESLLRVQAGRLRTLVHRGAAVQTAIAATALTREDEDRTLLVGTAGGAIYRLVDDTPSPLTDGLGGRITALASDGDRIWIGLGREGLHLVKPATAKPAVTLRPRGEICSNHVTKITRHRGKLVVGSFDEGACVLESWGWRALPGLPSPMVHGVGTSATGAVEIGPRQVALSSAYGVTRIWRKRNGRTRTRFTSHEKGAPFAITALAAAGEEVFVGSETEGVKAMGYGRGRARHYQDPVDLPENWVMGLSAVRSDELWVATCQQGVAHLDGLQRTWIDRHRGLADNRVIAVAADTRGAFVGTLGGLSWVSADHATVRGFGLERGLPDPRAAGLYRDGDDLWLATEAGLARFAVSWKARETMAAAR